VFPSSCNSGSLSWSRDHIRDRYPWLRLGVTHCCCQSQLKFVRAKFSRWTKYISSQNTPIASIPIEKPLSSNSSHRALKLGRKFEDAVSWWMTSRTPTADRLIEAKDGTGLHQIRYRKRNKKLPSLKRPARLHNPLLPKDPIDCW
jgi:hypothetical protein